MQVISSSMVRPGARVFVRTDLDVPIINGLVQEPYRLISSLETLKLITSSGGVPVIAGHVGKPNGHKNPEVSTAQLEPFFDEHLGKGSYKLLENLRFDPREEKNSIEYAQEISSGCQLYVNECFSASHREHSSITQIPKLLPAFAGIHLAKEVTNLSKLLTATARPFVVLIGGAKLESKKPTVTKFLQKADTVMLGGRIGLDWTENIPTNLILPIDYTDTSADIGLQTINLFTAKITTAKTILWAGPMGMYEDPRYFVGTHALAHAVARQTAAGAFSVVGGGDTIACLTKAGVLDQISFVSTGGGAMLEFLVEGTLPGIRALG